MDWWKDKVSFVVIRFDCSIFKHNTHHAATNVIDHDGDIDLAPLIAFIPADLKKYKQPVEKFLLKVRRQGIWQGELDTFIELSPAFFGNQPNTQASHIPIPNLHFSVHPLPAPVLHPDPSSPPSLLVHSVSPLGLHRELLRLQDLQEESLP